MTKKLKPGEKKFLKEYVDNGGNGTEAAKKAFNIKDPNSAGVKASRLLRTDKIQSTLDKWLPDDLLHKKHQDLLSQRQLAYFVFSKELSDEEIAEHMKANGLDLIVIRPSDKGKMAFYSIDDQQAISKALDMGYKLKGKYAPEKRELSGTVEMIPDERLEALADKLDELTA